MLRTFQMPLVCLHLLCVSKYKTLLLFCWSESHSKGVYFNYARIGGGSGKVIINMHFISLFQIDMQNIYTYNSSLKNCNESYIYSTKKVKEIVFEGL